MFFIKKIKPFFDFRNNLIYRFLLIDDKILLKILKKDIETLIISES